MREQMVRGEEAEGGTITYVGWSTIEVRTEDGRLLTIRAEEGHSGIELNVYEVAGAPQKEKS